MLPRLSPITLAPVRLAVVPAALAAGLGAAAVMAGAPEPPGGAEIAVSLLVGWSFVVSGLVAWERRPENPTGRVMVATGFAWFAHELVWATEPLLWTLGQLLESTYLLGVGYLLVTFPDGRLQTAAERWVTATAALIVVPLQLAWLLLGYGDAQGCSCPENLLLLVDAPTASEAIVRVQQALGAVLGVATVAVVVGRWRRASPSRRFAIAPVLATGAAVFALIIPWTLNDLLDEPLDDWPDVALELALAAVPVAFLLGLLRTRLARGAVAERENERLHAELRARLEELSASRARIVAAALQERRRIERDLHDGTQQRLVSIAMTLGLADARLDRDPAAVRPLLDQARAGLTDALEELRALSQGIHPGILTERGLRAALEELAYGSRLPLELEVGISERLPAPIEAAAYYVVSEALTNIAKHASATAVRVRVARVDGSAVVEVADDGVGGADGTRGTGLRGLSDRVDALGGRLNIESPPGRGTVVQAQIPCA
jgi:signal transduction histidine kinase